MKNLTNKLVISVAALSLAGLLYGHSINNYKFFKNITYQGYYIDKEDGTFWEVFDPETLSERARDDRTAKYSLETEDVPSLKIGQKYDVIYGIPNFKWLYSDRILKVKKVKN